MGRIVLPEILIPVKVYAEATVAFPLIVAASFAKIDRATNETD